MRALPILLLALTLSACATATRYDAAGDIHALLAAIRDNDTARFEAHVDRAALKAQLRARLTAGLVQRSGPAAAGLAPFLRVVVDPVVDVAVQPEVFLAVAEAKGYRPSQPLPSRVSITSSLRYLEGDRVCVIDERDGPCLLVFAFEGPLDALKLPQLRVGLVPQ